MRVKSCPNRITENSESVSEDEGPSFRPPPPPSGTEIFLEIDGQQIRCTKEELINYSGYFSSMFSHDYVESTKKVITVQDNEFYVFFHLINLARDSSHKIPDTELISVLKNAFIFQFDGIVDQLQQIVMHKITPTYSFLILKEDLPFEDINMRAKFKALTSFNESRASDYLVQLSLRQVCEFLGSVFLKCNNELDVFDTAMQWYSYNTSETVSDDDLIKLLSCLNYNNIEVTNLTKIMVSEHVSKSASAQELIKCIISLKSGDSMKEGMFKEEILKLAEKLVNNGRNRRSSTSLCIILDSTYQTGTEVKKKKKIKLLNGVNYNNREITSNIIEYEYSTPNCVTDSKVALYYDAPTGIVHPITNIEPEYLSTGSETGYVIGYKDCMLFLGVEDGYDDYDRYNYAAYDTGKSTWHKLLLLPPQKREFFTALVSGDILYIAGGIGSFRIVQDNINSCNIKTGEWYGAVNLPYRGRELVCCDYLGSLFIMNIADKAGYFFNTTFHTAHTIIDKDNILANFRELFAVFEYKKDIYLIGNKSILKMEFDQQHLHITGSISISNPVSDYDAIEAVVCEDIVYCLYKVRVSVFDDRKITLASFNMLTQEFSKIFDDVSEDQSLELNGKFYRLTLYSKIIPLQYYKILQNEEFVNNWDF